MFASTSKIPFVLLLLLFAISFNSSICSQKAEEIRCNEKDRGILSIFKQGIVDPSNRLSSWSTEEDCCTWLGVHCDNITGRVTKLDLQNAYFESEPFRGEINLSVLQLEFLNYLDLSLNEFETIRIPSINDSTADSHIHNQFSNLHYLDLTSFSDHLRMDDLHWLSYVSSIKYLNLSGINLHKETNWLQSFSILPSLSELRLRYCQLNNPSSPFGRYVNFTSLQVLDLFSNNLESEILTWVSNLSGSLFHLQLSGNLLTGQIPDWLGQFKYLKVLDLSINSFSGVMPLTLGNLSSLTELDLFSNHLSGPIPNCWSQLKNLEMFSLSDNSFHGPMPSTLKNVSSLIFLILSSNNLRGSIPDWLGQFKHLKHVDLSENSFHGPIPRLSASVITLSVSYNNFSSISSFLCHGMTEKNNLKFLNASYNQLSGELLDCWTGCKSLIYLNLESNNLTGRIPNTISLLSNLHFLHLSNNRFFGEIPISLQNNKNLRILNLEGNDFSGSIPNWIWQNMTALVLRSNQFNGTIPSQLCQISSLIILDLADNKLSGPIPKCLSNIATMVLVDAFGNPTIGFEIRDNYGPLVLQMFNDEEITLLSKGRKLKYDHSLGLVCLLDISNNELSGSIPPELFDLQALIFLNLSRNQLTGKLPQKIGDMKNLESLDLSWNQLCGEIPQSISSLSFLGVLNLSYNHFSGKIPSGTQLQSFDKYSYIGNAELCGEPLPNCSNVGKPNGKEPLGEDKNESETLPGFYIAMEVGFVTGFLGVCIPIFYKRSWRHAYFKFVDDMKDRLYVAWVLKMKPFLQI